MLHLPFAQTPSAKARNSNGFTSVSSGGLPEKRQQSCCLCAGKKRGRVQAPPASDCIWLTSNLSRALNFKVRQRVDRKRSQKPLVVSCVQVLCLWDVSSQLCLQHVTFPRTPEDARVLLFYQEEHQQLLLSFDSRLLLLEALKEERRTSSHEHPVTCVLYNSLFRQVVSSDSASSVICWLPDTGQKVKQFNRCHGNAAISTMGLDGTQTRLFTAGADRTVKVWDFSGRCLHRMNPALGRTGSISQVLLLRRTILVMGWKRVLTAFHLHSFSQPVVEPSEWNGGVQHDSNVLCAAFQPPQTLVTGGSCVEDADMYILSSLTHKRHAKSHLKYRRGADLVSCGGLGAVRLWNIHRGQLVGQFTAHNGKLGSIVMAISPCGKYLVTADKEGTIKVWDIEHYCLKPEEQVSEELPELLDSFRPHLDHVTHLEICEHGDKLLLLSSSSDCSVALSYLPGETVGLFGQVNKHVQLIEYPLTEYITVIVTYSHINHKADITAITLIFFPLHICLPRQRLTTD
uniref:WD repeat domain 49 n=1 Tax=Kryptolebias marmoratus TaxID=37003 RepID=A0A3Q2ZMI8_KRYMA